MQKRKYLLYILPLIGLMMALFIGRYPITFRQVITVLTGMGDQSISYNDYSLIWDIRMPRAILSILVGGSLGISGAALQGLFRNPLVDSGILGVSSGAGFGAALAIILFSSTFFIYLSAFIFSMLAVFVSVRVGRIKSQSTTILLVLGGVIVSSIFSSMISLLKYVADPYNELPSIVFWMMGSLSNASYKEIIISGLPMVIGVSGLLLMRWRINVLSMGELEAQSLGLNARFFQLLIILCTSLATAGAVAVCGIISWIGLVIPHIGRMLVGNNNKDLLPVSFALGGLMLLIIDVIGRVITGGELPLNILTALIGGPFYIYLLKKTKAGVWS
ncbi:iron ABC transporter permease [Acidaminobacter sp. JC074]|uniref:FecCD family ABC transporter permease n=1 Tax=Acidaminobacter sp. JC074 TaxID=2530199 RepID=UPI001F10B513|nr:iron ABC transporter permease [Acidaminobacter sp. JC074]MCH4888579.1 iron ABC transporter permease [Acidaminobacter sp. JC074]